MNNKSKIICFVGPDKTRKTTISKSLSKLTLIPRFKATSEHNSFVNNQDNFLNELLFADTRQIDLIRQIQFSMIMDRGWPCEYVYSKYYNRTTSLSVLLNNDNEYAKIGAQIVFCYRNNYSNYYDDLDDKINPEALQNIHSLYEEFFTKSKCKIIRLCVDDKNNDECIQFLNQELNLG